MMILILQYFRKVKKKKSKFLKQGIVIFILSHYISPKPLGYTYLYILVFILLHQASPTIADSKYQGLIALI